MDQGFFWGENSSTHTKTLYFVFLDSVRNPQSIDDSFNFLPPE